ncbi:MAG TPA: LuxR C-terminal-related transcriptional regulator [Flexivirga sp.]|uniref:helix-turn-helix transcriptional regulator n=1 Tax=Flexivirga sp. TaxID=1962927 RepID=UPI002D19A5FA|nr:LuxR C-terminal-related transcriptional regulator [Flexivirga sp.]HWC21663.1 LuxR C-terminal-related transcriptional regulator [Flexivirga sp.]
MDIPPTIVPTRRLELEALVDVVGSCADPSAAVLVTGASGSGSTTFAKGFAGLCTPGGRVDAAEVRRLAGLPWATGSQGDGLRGLLVDPSADPVVAASRLVDTIAPSSHRWDCVLLVSNAHLVDRATIEGLLSAIRLSARAQLLVVLDWTEPLHPGAPLSAHQHGDRGRANLYENLYDDVRSAAHLVVELAPLTTDDVAMMAERLRVIVPAAETAHLVRHTGGNARMVVELLREIAPTDWLTTRFDLPAPSSVRRAVRAWSAGATPDAARLVDAIAVLEEGDRLAGRILVHVAEQVAGVEATPATMTQVLRGGLVVQLDTEATLLRMRDNVTRRAILDELGPMERTQMHARAAVMVEDPASCLRHRWFAGGPIDDELAEQLARHAGAAASSGEWATAGELLELAARATSDPDTAGARLVESTDALVGAGDIPGASRHLAELESLRETPRRNAVLGYLAIVRGRSSEADSRLNRAWELANPRRDAATAALIAQRYVLHSLANCQAGELVSWADRALELADGNTPAAVEAAAIRGLGNAVVDAPAAELLRYDELIATLSEGAVAARVRMAAGWLRLATDSPRQARDELERAVPTDHLGGSLRISLWARAWLARVQFLTGDWTTALHTATTGAGLADSSGMALLAPLLHWTRAQVYTLRGDWPMAERCLRQGSVSQHDYPIMRVPAALGQAALHEARADYPAVVRTLAFLTEPWAEEWVAGPGFWPWADVYANALVVSGQLDQADRFLRPHEERAAAAELGSAIGRLAYARGRWHGQHGDLDAARERFTTAIDLIAELPYPYDLARAHFAFGQTLRRAGRRAEADAVLSTAREQFARLGAATYVRRCDRELAAGGVNAQRTKNAHSDVLTPQESAVASLVAQGRSNKDVAAELFLSVKTVQYHLTRVYAKFGVRSRSQLAAQWSAGDEDSPTSTPV